MAQFTLQGRLRVLVNGEGVWCSKNPAKCKLSRGGRLCGVLGFGDFCSIYGANVGENGVNRNGYLRKMRILASSSGNLRKSVNGNEGFHDFDGFDDDEDDDDLSCFRGLVLDISYRPVNVVCWKRAICLEFMEKKVHAGSLAVGA